MKTFGKKVRNSVTRHKISFYFLYQQKLNFLLRKRYSKQSVYLITERKFFKVSLAGAVSVGSL